MNSIFGVYSYIIGVIIRKIDSFFVVQTIDAGVFLHKYSSLSHFFIYLFLVFYLLYTHLFLLLCLKHLKEMTYLPFYILH